MPPKQQQSPSCLHPSTTTTPSPHATQVKYHQPSKQARQDATRPSPSATATLPPPPTRSDLDGFPAPLVLPGDDLALDPEYPPQSFQEWYDEEERNPVTTRRKTVYLVEPPGVDRCVAEVKSWTKPVHDTESDPIPTPETDDVLNYLTAFFHGLPVKQLKMSTAGSKGKWSFAPWTDGEDEDSTPHPTKQKSSHRQRKKQRNPTKESFIALSTPTESIRIRTRPCPDGLYPRQLNLNDLLDVAISILPRDAYALCMLVQQDLYEDEDDTFVCGRAYGGSRVAVVSTARYSPVLDAVQGVERVHAWPGAHCSSYVENACRDKDVQRVRKKAKMAKEESRPRPTNPNLKNRNGPLEAALDMLRQPHYIDTDTDTDTNAQSQSQKTLWLWRVIRTVSHELCHCVGLDHCVYYACIMQGSASLSEDTRQPPYLCPVDLAKLLCATGSGVEERDRALLRYCEQPRMREFVYFRAFAAWLRASLDD